MENVELYNNQMAIKKDADSYSIIESMDLKCMQDKLNKINAFHAIVKNTLIPDIDYGMIPGAKKNTLFKSGAENILMLFGLITNIEIIAAVPLQLTKDTNFVSYTVKCRLIKNGEVVSEGIGTCSSGEKKYFYADALDIANTIMKMASKRALIDAVLHIASLSAVFAEEDKDMSDFLDKEALENMGVPEASNYKLTFGKHKGKKAGDVYKEDPDYVKWFFEKGKDEKTKRAFEVLCAAVKAQAEKAAKKTENMPEVDGGGDSGVDVASTDCNDACGESLGELHDNGEE